MKKVNSLFGLEDVKDFYYITTCGKVISFVYNKIRLMSPVKSDGYLRVGLIKKDGSRGHVFIHRLVALAYIKNDNVIDKIQVNHIDENRSNNMLWNLEWATPTENLNHGNRSINSAKTHIDKRDITYYEVFPIARSCFRKRCKTHSWDINDFKEVFNSFIERNDGKGKYKMFNYFYMGEGNGSLTEDTCLKGENSPQYKPIVYWETHHTTKYAFKCICEKYGWNFYDFEAIFSCKRTTDSCTRNLYTFKIKTE